MSHTLPLHRTKASNSSLWHAAPVRAHAHHIAPARGAYAYERAGAGAATSRRITSKAQVLTSLFGFSIMVLSNQGRTPKWQTLHLTISQTSPPRKPRRRAKPSSVSGSSFSAGKCSGSHWHAAKCEPPRRYKADWNKGDRESPSLLGESRRITSR